MADEEGKELEKFEKGGTKTGLKKLNALVETMNKTKKRVDKLERGGGEGSVAIVIAQTGTFRFIEVPATLVQSVPDSEDSGS